jgi:hypothetical protein
MNLISTLFYLSFISCIRCSWWRPIPYFIAAKFWGYIHIRKSNSKVGFSGVLKHFSGKTNCLKIKTSRATSRDSCGQNPNVSETISSSPDEGGGDGLRNVELLSTTETACCPRRFYRVQLPWNLQSLFNCLLGTTFLVCLLLIRFNNASNGRMIMNDELWRMWTEAILTYFKVLSQHLAGVADKHHEISQKG